MKRILHDIRYLILVPVFLSATSVLAERTFKWVDEEGNVHYGDRVPPQHSKRERQVINEQGRTVKVYEAAKTPEQMAEARRIAAIKAERKKRAEAQARHDRTLLASYSNEADMTAARDGKLASIDGMMELTISRINSLKKRLTKLTRDAAEYERSGKQVPRILQSQLENTREQISRNEGFIEAKNLEKQGIERKFSADVRRYRELTSGEPTTDDAQTTRTPGPISPTDQPAKAEAEPATTTEQAAKSEPAPAATTEQPAKPEPAPAATTEQAAKPEPAPAATTEQPAKAETEKKQADIKLSRDDRKLLATYASTEELLLAQEKKLAPLDALIDDTYNRIDSMHMRLAELSDQADKFQSRGRKLPEALLREMKDLLDQITSSEKLLESKRQEKQDKEQKYEAEIERYSELKLNR